MIDIHSHILPFLDDGPKTFEESIEMCKIAAEDGITTIVATPHSMNGMYESESDKIVKAVKELNLKLKEAQVSVKILPGAELHINERLLEDIRTGKALTMNNNKKHILLELPFLFTPPGTDKLIFDLRSIGIIPIIAHAERITFFQRNPKILEQLVKSGILVQISAGSLSGLFGTRERKCAVKFLKNKMVHFIASDAHSAVSRPPVLTRALEEASRIVGEKEAEKLVLENPRQIILIS